MTTLSIDNALRTVADKFSFSVDKFPLYGPDNMATPHFGLFKSDTMECVGKTVSARYVPHTTEDILAITEAAAEATTLQRKLSQEADDKLLDDLKAKGVQVTTVDKAAFAKATAAVDAKWLTTPIGPYLKKVIAAAR